MYKQDYSTLKISDLLEARDAYQRHLSHMDNVVGTAIGRYYIRKKDPDYKDPSARLDTPSHEERNFSNSDIRDWSEPCVMVLVKHWPKLDEILKTPDQFIPPYLYLPDDRRIPTCVIRVTESHQKDPPADDILYAPDLIGGGYPILSEVQGQKRVGSVGCLVTDGHSVFALTNRHVTGPKGQIAYSIRHGERQEVGAAVAPSIWTIPFMDAYPSWPGFRTVVNLDAGLIRVTNIDEWTSQVYGIGQMGELENSDIDNITLDMLGRNVRAFGSLSGLLKGKIKGLFYRYRSLGGIDFVADFLIGPRRTDKTIPTRDGDSGTVWFFQQRFKKPPKPFAMQWGSSIFGDESGNNFQEFVLASNLTVICRELGVRIISDWETGLPETWGKLAHYQIGAKACDLITNDKLRKLMQANKEIIGLSDNERVNMAFPKDKQTSFIALADVPDLWWKTYRGKEKPSHFADMDQPNANGRTLLDLYDADDDSLDPAAWLSFYESLGIEQRYQGLLPFRVKQFYEAMVEFVRKQQVSEFVTAAGILSHYIGDAANSLHTSQYHHGRDESEKGVHAQYETKMVERYRDIIVSEINQRLADLEIAYTFSGADKAKHLCINLIKNVMTVLPPLTIIEHYNKSGSGKKKNEYLWEHLGEATLDCLIDGTFTLAIMWQSAWIEGGGDSISAAKLKTIHKNTLMGHYKDTKFIESKWLDEM